MTRRPSSRSPGCSRSRPAQSAASLLRQLDNCAADAAREAIQVDRSGAATPAPARRCAPQRDLSRWRRMRVDTPRTSHRRPPPPRAARRPSALPNGPSAPSGRQVGTASRRPGEWSLRSPRGVCRNNLLAPSSREAVFTTSPAALYLSRSCEPMLPTVENDAVGRQGARSSAAAQRAQSGDKSHMASQLTCLEKLAELFGREPRLTKNAHQCSALETPRMHRNRHAQLRLRSW